MHYPYLVLFTTLKHSKDVYHCLKRCSLETIFQFVIMIKTQFINNFSLHKTATCYFHIMYALIIIFIGETKQVFA